MTFTKTTSAKGTTKEQDMLNAVKTVLETNKINYKLTKEDDGFAVSLLGGMLHITSSTRGYVAYSDYSVEDEIVDKKYFDWIYSQIEKMIDCANFCESIKNHDSYFKICRNNLQKLENLCTQNTELINELEVTGNCLTLKSKHFETLTARFITVTLQWEITCSRDYIECASDLEFSKIILDYITLFETINLENEAFGKKLL